MPHTLVVVRHAKSDWSEMVNDRERPLAKRGRRQAPAAGRWIAAELGGRLDLAVVSPAVRARQTWDLLAGELSDPPQARVDEAAYTFDGDVLARLVRALPADAERVALVGHNPAVEELIELLTGSWVAMPTSALAVVELSSWSTAGDSAGLLVAAGRPADGTTLEVHPGGG